MGHRVRGDEANAIFPRFTARPTAAPGGCGPEIGCARGGAGRETTLLLMAARVTAGFGARGWGKHRSIYQRI